MDWSKSDVPAKFRKLHERARAGKAKAAIRLHCLMCVGWEPVEVERCTATGCPLYPLRNLAAQAETEAADRAKRRERALKAGLRPPISPSADGHGDREVAPISNATDRIRGKSLAVLPSRLKTPSASAMHEGAEAAPDIEPRLRKVRGHTNLPQLRDAPQTLLRLRAEVA